MGVFVTITSQGQISIPAKIRKSLGLEKFRKAFINVDGHKIIIEPVDDILSFEGSLHQKAKKNKSINQIIREEEKAYSNAVVKKHQRQLKKLNPRR